jgi:predicted Rossmann-fold nucleotide-binding protein
LHVSPHSAADLFFELKGNGKSDVVLTHVKTDFFKSKYIQLKSSIVIPQLKLSETRPVKKPYNPDYDVFRYAPGVEDTGEIVRVSSVDPSNRAALRELSDKIEALPETKHIFYFNTFPPARILNEFTCSHNIDKTGAIVFSRAPISDETFSSDYYTLLNLLQEQGVEVVWDHPGLGRLYYHRIAFMQFIERLAFDQAYSSNSIACAFGSSSVCTSTDLDDIQTATEGFARFTGGKGYIFNGGGPHMMSAFSEAARHYGLHAGTINLIKAEEAQATKPDLFIPFSKDHLNTRQSVMIDTGSVFMVFEGGLGTLYELYECGTKNKINRSNKPTLIIGNTPFQKAAHELIQLGVKTHKIPGYVLDSTYRLNSGSEVYQTLMQHYNFQDAV